MKIQSLSIVVPTKNCCVNNCKFCVSRTHTNPYEDKISPCVKQYMEGNDSSGSTIEYIDYFNRLQFARDNGCNVVVLTGTGEPVQNMKFIEFFSEVNSTLKTPFKSIEVQTTGVLLDFEKLAKLRKFGVTTISFSISNIFDNDRNLELIGCNEKLRFDVYETIKMVKQFGFNLRLSLNLVNDYDVVIKDGNSVGKNLIENWRMIKSVINKCKELGADQVTFRKLYKSELNSEIDNWIEKNASKNFYDELVKYVKNYGKFLGVLPFGPSVYNIEEMSICVDSDCMSEEIKDTYKYLILRENAHIYFRWETKSSLVF